MNKTVKQKIHDDFLFCAENHPTKTRGKKFKTTAPVGYKYLKISGLVLLHLGNVRH